MRSFAGYESVRFDAFWFHYSHIIHRYRIVQISQFALIVFPCISWIQPRSKRFRLIDAFDLRPARATWALRGLIRSKHQRRLRSKPKSTQIKNILNLKHFEAFWSYIFSRVRLSKVCRSWQHTSSGTSFSEDAITMKVCSRLAAWLVNEGAMVLWREMASKSHVCWNAARIAREAWESSV